MRQGKQPVDILRMCLHGKYLELKYTEKSYETLCKQERGNQVKIKKNYLTASAVWLLCYGVPRETVKPVSLETLKQKTSWTKAQENVLQRKCSSQRWRMRAFPSLNYPFSGWCFTSHSDPKPWCTPPKTCLGD